jgi:tetratricopeptide (TPR) repeat protein
MSRLGKIAGLALGIWVAAARVEAQSVAEHVTLGDAAYEQRRPKDALEHFLKAIAADSTHYESRWKASRAEVDLAEAAPKGAEMDSLMAAAQRHAEAAVRLRTNDPEGHFSLARALGRKALSVGTMDRIRFSKVIRSEALDALKYDSTHAGALHVLGMWNAEIMRVNGFARAFARTFLGAEVFGLANWADAQRLLDLAGICADRGNKAKARELYESIGSAPVVESNDDLYKRQAAERLKKL